MTNITELTVQHASKNLLAASMHFYPETLDFAFISLQEPVTEHFVEKLCFPRDDLANVEHESVVFSGEKVEKVKLIPSETCRVVSNHKLNSTVCIRSDGKLNTKLGLYICFVCWIKFINTKIPGSGLYIKSSSDFCLQGIITKQNDNEFLRQFPDPLSVYTFMFVSLFTSTANAITNSIRYGFSNSDVYCDLKTFNKLYTCEVINLKSNIDKAKTVGGSNMGGKGYYDIEKISMEDKNIKVLPDGLGELFPNLQVFYAGNVRLNEITKSNFHGMEKLKFLQVFSNKLTHISEDTFSELKSLESLRLSNNTLRELPANLLVSLPRLTSFNAASNEISVLPQKFFDKNQKLEFVFLNDNPFHVIMPTFAKLKRIKFVGLSNAGCIDAILDFSPSSSKLTKQTRVLQFDELLITSCQNEGEESSRER